MMINNRRISFCISKSSSMKIILFAIIIHFVVSISFLHFFLNCFFENQISSEIYEEENFGNIAVKLKKINLVRNNLITKNEISLKGWWFDHNKFQTSIECQKKNLNSCFKVFSTDCKPDRIRAMYQFIPIKDSFNLTEFEISLSTKTGKLTELNQNKSFGLQVIIEFNNGEIDYMNIEFSYNLDEWFKRKSRFNTYSSNLKVSKIALMLYCFGYTGKIMFKDVNLVPINSFNEKLKEINIIDDCKLELNTYQNKTKNYLVYNFIENYTEDEIKNQKVTLVSQVSIDRIQVFEKTLSYWKGPISLAVHVEVTDPDYQIDQWQKIYLEKKLRVLTSDKPSNIVLIITNQKDNYYPINILRNVAFKNVKTEYAFLVDADFIPSPNIINKLEKHLNNFNRKSFNFYDLDKTAFVIPAFEYTENQKFDDSLPKTKEEFMQLVFRDEPIIQPFRIIESIDSHKLTNYWKWYISNTIYKVNGYLDKYEPYLIIKKTKNTPLFDERFTGYGMNKVTFITELYAANYSLFVLPDVWITHSPHKNSIYSQEFLQNTQLRLKNRFFRFLFICNLISKYKIKNHKVIK